MNRYLQLDFLRGLCLLIMTIDHFGDLSIVEIFGFISAAEAFVFISGIVSGIVYYRRSKTNEFRTLRVSAFKRAFEIYKYHIVCLIVLVLVVSVNIDIYRDFYEHRAGLFTENVFLAAFLNIFFLYKTYHLDILPMYVIFLLLLPVALRYADARTGKYLLIISALLWCINLFGATDLFYSWLNQLFPARGGNFQLLGWQVLFFAGFALGVMEVKGKLVLLKNNKAMFVSAVGCLLLLFLLKRFDLSAWLSPVVREVLFGKSNIGAVRLLNFFALSFAIAFVLNKYNQWGKTEAFRLLGRHSLFVFTFQTVILFVVIPFYQELYVHGFLSTHFDSKVMQKGLSLMSTLPLSLIIFIPALWKERSMKKAKVALAGKNPAQVV